MSDALLLFTGSYNTGPGGRTGQGIGIYALDGVTVAATPLFTADDIENPSFLAVDMPRRRVYAASEVTDRPEGWVVAYSLDPRSGALVAVARQSTLGSVTCHIGFDRTGRFLFAENFGRGVFGEQSLSVLPLIDGDLSAAVSSVEHRGKGAVSPYQDSPHAHCAAVSADNRFLIVTDFGTDQIFIYRFDEKSGELGGVSSVCTMPPGSGPRHLIFAADGTTAFVTNELSSMVATLLYDADSGTLAVRQMTSTLPAGVTGQNYPADLHLSRDGRFLYVSNRGHDSIAAFDTAGGNLRLVGCYPTEGKWPRNFTISPDGSRLLVANQHSDRIVAFRVNSDGGALSDPTAVLEIKAPAFVTVATRDP